MILSLFVTLGTAHHAAARSRHHRAPARGPAKASAKVSRMAAEIPVSLKRVTSQDLPIEAIMEEEASDVEVCTDFICNRLREEILKEASKCRELASFKRRRMRVRRSFAANSCKLFHDNNYKLSKGKCSAAVRGACERSGIDARYLNVNAYDLHKHSLMEKAGFVNLRWKYNELTAPLGSTLVYLGGVGHRYGHVEIRVNPSLYCSDHCTNHAVTAVSQATRARYKLGRGLPAVHQQHPDGLAAHPDAGPQLTLTADRGTW